MAERLDTPRVRRSFFKRLTGEASFEESFGRFSEAFATFMGTPKFILYMTAFVIVWITVNAVGIYGYSFDPYPFILLNLAFSTQASYAAPLILLAQNRQEQRDRVTAEQDRSRAERNLADTEFLIREIASLRLSMQDVATRDFVRSELRDTLEDLLAEIRREKEAPSEDTPAAS